MFGLSKILPLRFRKQDYPGKKRKWRQFSTYEGRLNVFRVLLIEKMSATSKGHICVVAGCSKRQLDGVSVHMFPKDERQRAAWIRFVKLTRADWTGPSQYTRWYAATISTPNATRSNVLKSSKFVLVLFGSINLIVFRHTIWKYLFENTILQCTW